MSNSETAAEFPAKDLNLIINSLTQARNIASDTSSILEDNNIEQVHAYLDFVLNIIHTNPAIRNLVGSVMPNNDTDKAPTYIHLAIKMISTISNDRLRDINIGVDYIDKILMTLQGIYKSHLIGLKNKYQLADECDITMDHVIMHLESTVRDMTQKDGVTPIPDKVNVDQLLHDIQISITILRVLNQIS
mgnify:CR=1 FL=1